MGGRFPARIRLIREKCFHYPWNKVLPIENLAKTSLLLLLGDSANKHGKKIVILFIFQ